MASQSSNDDEVTSKLQEASTTHIDGKIIKQTIRELKKIFGKEFKVYVILGVDTTTDPDILIADMVVLNSDPNPFVYPPLPSFNHLICNTPLPQGYVLYVALKGTQKSYVYQVPNSSPALTSPYLKFPGGSQGMVPCKDPRNEPPDEFLWDQEGSNDLDYTIFKEENNTKLYWQYNGDGKIVTFNENNEQAINARLNVIANSRMASKSSKNVKVTSKPQEVSTTSIPAKELTTHIPGEVIEDTIKNLKNFFSEKIKVYVMLGVYTTTDYDIMPADMVVLDSYKNPFVYPPLSDNNQLNHLISDTPLPRGYVLYVVLQGAQKAYFYQVQISGPPVTYVKAGPYLKPTSVSGGMVPCKDTTNEPQDEFLWDQEGPDQVYKIYKEQNNTKLYWQYNGDGALVKLTNRHPQGLCVRLYFKP